MRRRYLAIGAVVVGLLTGCSSGAHRSSAPPTTTTTAAASNPDVVPAVITPAYVDAVFRVLNHINGNAVRALLSSSEMTSTVTSDLAAIYGPPLYAVEEKVFRSGLSQDTSNLRRPPGDRVTKVISLITANASCIFAKTSSDLSAVEIHPTANPASEYWELQRKDPSLGATNINPTPWILSYNADYQTATHLSSTC